MVVCSQRKDFLLLQVCADDVENAGYKCGERIENQLSCQCVERRWMKEAVKPVKKEKKVVNHLLVAHPPDLSPNALQTPPHAALLSNALY
jgi:hypothetical protein